MNIVIVVFYIFPKYYAGITHNVFNDPFYAGIQTLHKVFIIMISYHLQSLSILLTSSSINNTVSSTTVTTTYLPNSSTSAQKNNYFSRTLSDWNMLPVHLIEITDTDTFKTGLQSLL